MKLNSLAFLGATIIYLSTIASAKASYEVVCESIRSSLLGNKPENTGSINKRIKELENDGKKVEITHLSTSVGGAGYGAGSPQHVNYGAVIVEKNCVSIKY